MNEKQPESPKAGPKFSAKPDDARPKPRRFYQLVTVAEDAGAFAIRLDNRPLKTPMKNAVKVPSRKLAEASAEEWQSQEETIDIEDMLITKFINTAIDRVAPRKQIIVDEITSFAATDLVCYRADQPETLITQEAKHWDPVLAWAKNHHGLVFKTTSGISHVQQEAETLQQFSDLINRHDPFALTAIHNLTTITGSALLTLALVEGALEPETVWLAAHIDEDFQIERWGEDGEARRRRALRHKEFLKTHEFYHLSAH